MREEDILDNSYDDNFFFGLKNQKKMLVISCVGLAASLYSISQSKNESGLLRFDDYPDIFGGFLLLVTTIIGFFGVHFWRKEYTQKYYNKSSSISTLVLQIIILIPSVIGAVHFIFAYCFNYFYSVIY